MEKALCHPCSEGILSTVVQIFTRDPGGSRSGFFEKGCAVLKHTEAGKVLSSGTNTEAQTQTTGTRYLTTAQKKHFYLTTCLPCAYLVHCPGTRQEHRHHRDCR